MALLNGGYLPDDRRGVVLEGYMHIADWYATFCGMLGIDASDPEAEALGLPAIDSLNIWPYMMGEVDKSPRFEIVISDTTIIYDAYKLMIGKYPYAVWQSAVWPDKHTLSHDAMKDTVLDCIDIVGDWAVRTTKRGCLFNLTADPEERTDISDDFPDVVETLRARLFEVLTDAYDPDEHPELAAQDSCPPNYNMQVTIGEYTKDLSCGCWMSEYNYNGFDGPFQDVSDQHIYYSLDQLPPEAVKAYDPMDVDEEKVDDIDVPTDEDLADEGAETVDVAEGDEEIDAVAEEDDADAVAEDDNADAVAAGDETAQSVEELGNDSADETASSSDDVPQTGHLPDDVLNKIMGNDGDGGQQSLYVDVDINGVPAAQWLDLSTLYLGICVVTVLCVAKWILVYTKSEVKDVSMNRTSYHTFGAVDV